MLIADSHEFIELYRGDKDLRMGMEMLKVESDLAFVSLAPNRASPTDRDRFGVDTLDEIGLPALPERFDLRLLPSSSVRFAQKESGGVVSWMPGYYRALKGVVPDVILENPFSWLTPRSYQTYAYSWRHRTPVVYYDPGDDIPISIKHRVMALWESPVVQHAAAIITYNDAGKHRFVNKYGYPQDRIHVIPKPVDVGASRYMGPVQDMRAMYGAGDNCLVVSYVGRLTNYKGSATLLEVARRALGDHRMKDVRFVFVGGTLVSEELTSNYRLPNTFVTGMVPHEEVSRHLAASDVVVFPGVTRPGGFPTAVAEAMAAAKALIVGVGERSDFLPLSHLDTAFLVPPADPGALYQAVLDLQEHRDVAARLAERVGRLAVQRMDYGIVAREYLALIRRVLGE